MLIAEDTDSSKTWTPSSSCLESSGVRHQQCSVWGKHKCSERERAHYLDNKKIALPTPCEELISTLSPLWEGQWYTGGSLKGELSDGRAAFSHFLPSGYPSPYLKRRESGKECWKIKGEIFLIESNCSWNYLSIAKVSIAGLRNQVRVHYHEQPLIVLTPYTETINSSTETKQQKTNSLDCIKDLCTLASVLSLSVSETASFLQYPFPPSSISNKNFS